MGAPHSPRSARVGGIEPDDLKGRLPDFLPDVHEVLEGCHFADALSPSLLIHLLKVEGGAA